MQQQQQQIQLHHQLQANNLKPKDFYKKFYSRNPSEILIFENKNTTDTVTTSTTTTSPSKQQQQQDIEDATCYDGDEILDDSDELFFYDHDQDYDYDETSKINAIMKNANKSQHSSTSTENNNRNHFIKKPPPIPASSNKMIYKSAYIQNVLSKNRSNSCENRESLLSDRVKEASPSAAAVVISHLHSNSTSQLNSSSNNTSEQQQSEAIRVGMVEDLRKKFLTTSSAAATTSKQRNKSSTSKLSESSDYSHASIKIEKNTDESNELRILQPIILNTETKKVPTKSSTSSKSSINKNRLKSIERTLSTSAHIDDTYKMVKQSLFELRNDDKYIENVFFQLHNKLQDVANCLFSNNASSTSMLLDTDSLNSTMISQQHNPLTNIYEQTFNENLNIIHNNLALSNYLTLNDDKKLYIIENSMRGHVPRQKTFSPGDYRLKHFF